MKTKPEYKIIWEAPPDPVKVATELCRVCAKHYGLEFIGLEKTERRQA